MTALRRGENVSIIAPSLLLLEKRRLRGFDCRDGDDNSGVFSTEGMGAGMAAGTAKFSHPSFWEDVGVLFGVLFGVLLSVLCNTLLWGTASSASFFLGVPPLVFFGVEVDLFGVLLGTSTIAVMMLGTSTMVVVMFSTSTVGVMMLVDKEVWRGALTGAYMTVSNSERPEVEMA